MSHLPKPSWWQHSNDSWQHVNDAFNGLNQANLKRLADNSHWTELKSGVSNFSYRCQLNNCTYLVQIVNQTKIDLINTTQQFLSYSQVYQHKLLQSWMPSCLYESNWIRVFEWIAGEQTSAEIISEPSINKALCQFLSKLHSTSISFPAIDMQKYLQTYWLSATNKHPELKPEIKNLYEQAIHCSESFVASSICHNDLSPSNLLYSNKLYVVDWEYACLGDPLFDLAGVSFNFDLNAQQENYLIQQYIKTTGQEIEFERYKDLKTLYQLITQLWLL